MKYSLQLLNSYNECHKIFKEHAKTYYFGSLLFDYEKFLHVCAFYALVRVVDDIVDLENDIIKKRENIETFEKNFFILLNKSLEERIKLVNSDSYWVDQEYHIILLAVLNTTIIISIENSIYEKFFKSMKMDLDKYEYKNYTELNEYMEGSAAIIGEVMLKIISHNNSDPIYLKPEMKEYARSLGIAFQLTNFIRDINEDLSMTPSRVYIPIEDQSSFNSFLDSSCKIPNIIHNKNFKDLIEFQLSRCDKIYQQADIGIENIDTQYRYPILVAKILYSKINDRIRERNYDISKKICINKYEKCLILFQILDINNFIKTIFNLVFNYIRYNYLSYEYCIQNVVSNQQSWKDLKKEFNLFISHINKNYNFHLHLH